MPDNEMAEIHQRTTAAVTAAIQAAGQLAQAAIEIRIAQLQRSARASEEQARRIRAQVRAAQQAGATVWRPATRPSWWRQASAEDIARAWRASTEWAAVDPRAQAAQRVIVVRLAERGVHVDPQTGARPGDEAWLSDQLDRAAMDDVDRPADARPSEARHDDAGERRRTAQERQEAMAVHVREVWSPDRAERVIASAAWPALAYKLDQLERAGHDVRDLLRQVPGFVDRAHTPAAYAFRVVDDYATEQGAATPRADGNVEGDGERSPVTLDGEWRETGGGREKSGPGDRPETGHAGAAPVDRNVHGAKLAAQAFPQSTATAVADATSAGRPAEAPPAPPRSPSAGVTAEAPGR
ncbi:hypothetical protein GA0070558_16014 [Micromonospora haikouensis]|uniref:Uncharacterized protein n=1 Tax=Micromonospora haikouensis TaxID=686309 RepID=A0A1C4YPI3_9ACTN|nr:hypothetical protein [Micromonospora haikouensis]SCF22537.1 hypothetical protein GA0070558_16014 [Micromonospora haikouensis]